MFREKNSSIVFFANIINMMTIFCYKVVVVNMNMLYIFANLLGPPIERKRGKRRMGIIKANTEIFKLTQPLRRFLQKKRRGVEHIFKIYADLGK